MTLTNLHNMQTTHATRFSPKVQDARNRIANGTLRDNGKEFDAGLDLMIDRHTIKAASLCAYDAAKVREREGDGETKEFDLCD